MKDKAKKYHSTLYALPLSENDLAVFAEQVLNEFIDELEKNTTTISWNYGCDNVLFKDRLVDDKKSLNQIKKEFLSVRCNEKDKANTIGERTDRCETGDAETRGSDQLDKDQE